MLELTECIRSIFLGLVEGITEWLPISSTGHMILVNEFIGNEGSFTASDLYLYVIQLGAILAVVTIFFGKLNPFAPSAGKQERKKIWVLWSKIVVACIPAAVIGLALDDFMDKIENWQVVSAMLIIYGIAFIVVERIGKKAKITSLDDISYKTALMIGAFQVLSIVPGTSRSGATILGGMLVGCGREIAAEFAFFLAIPVMAGVSLIKIVKNLDMLTASNTIVLLIGMAVAYVVSLAAIRFLMKFVKSHSFTAFGIYRIVLGIAVILCLGVL